MSQKEKRIREIFTNQKNVRFSELDWLLMDLGFEKRQTGKGSSHYVYSHVNCDMLVVLVSHGKNDILKEYQVKKAIKAIKLLENL